MDDRAVGLGICVASTALFAYYTIWVLVTPFVEPGHAVRRARPNIIMHTRKERR